MTEQGLGGFVQESPGTGLEPLAGPGNTLPFLQPGPDLPDKAGKRMGWHDDQDFVRHPNGGFEFRLDQHALRERVVGQVPPVAAVPGDRIDVIAVPVPEDGAGAGPYQLQGQRGSPGTGAQYGEQGSAVAR